MGMLLRDAGLKPQKMPNVKHEVKDMKYCSVKDLIMLQPVPLSTQKRLREEYERFEDENRKCATSADAQHHSKQGGEL